MIRRLFEDPDGDQEVLVEVITITDPPTVRICQRPDRYSTFGRKWTEVRSEDDDT